MKGKEKLLSNYLEIITKTILQIDFAAQVDSKKNHLKANRFFSSIFQNIFKEPKVPIL